MENVVIIHDRTPNACHDSGKYAHMPSLAPSQES